MAEAVEEAEGRKAAVRGALEMKGAGWEGIKATVEAVKWELAGEAGHRAPAERVTGAGVQEAVA